METKKNVLMCIVMAMTAALFAACGGEDNFSEPFGMQTDDDAQQGEQPFRQDVTNVTNEGDAADNVTVEGDEPDNITVNVPPANTPTPEETEVTPPETEEVEEPDVMPDFDRDGIPDASDLCVNVAGNEFDSDGEGLADDGEEALGSNPCIPDTDRDGLSDFEEFNLGYNLLNSDSDGDTFDDLRDLCPLVFGVRFDADDDGMMDGEDPYFCQPDSDGDGILDGSDPTPMDLDRDADNDRLLDNEDLCQFGAVVNPNFDPQHYKLFNGERWEEVNIADLDLNEDQDRDGMRNAFEMEKSGNPCSFDSDFDELSDENEYFTWHFTGRFQPMMQTSVANMDSDGDDLMDGVDNCPTVTGNHDRWNNDSDRDGVPDGVDFNICAANTDGDQKWDGYDEYPLCYESSDAGQVTRGRLAEMIVQNMNLPVSPVCLVFSDIWAMTNEMRQAVCTLSGIGIMPGFADGTFRPEQPVTRAEGMVAIKKAVSFELYSMILDLNDAVSPGLEPEIPYSDMPEWTQESYAFLRYHGYYEPRSYWFENGNGKWFNPESWLTMPAAFDMMKRDREMDPQIGCQGRYEDSPPMPPTESATTPTQPMPPMSGP